MFFFFSFEPPSNFCCAGKLEARLANLKSHGRHQVNKLHHEIIHHTSSYSTIFHPQLKVHHSNISTVNERMSHLRFADLKTKMAGNPATRGVLLTCGEAFTSQVCCFCWNFVRFQKSRTTRCPSCAKYINRDSSAAHNILFVRTYLQLTVLLVACSVLLKFFLLYICMYQACGCNCD